MEVASTCATTTGLRVSRSCEARSTRARPAVADRSTGAVAAVLFLSTLPDYVDPEFWRSGLTGLIPDLDLRIYPEIGDPAAIELAIVDHPPPGVLAGFPKLRCVAYLGFGAGDLLADPQFPRHLPLVRLTDPSLIRQMTEYCLLMVLRQHRLLDDYERQQRERRWQPIRPPETPSTMVAIMGLGRIGRHAAEAFRTLGFRVAGWSRTAKQVPGVACFHGPGGLPSLLAEADYVICILPSTPATRHLVDARVLRLMKPGSVFINIGRGEIVRETDLIEALDAGRLKAAILDVAETEPLPEDSPLWTHPRVTITPHVANFYVDRALPEIAETCRRVLNGEPLEALVDPMLGY